MSDSDGVKFVHRLEVMGVRLLAIYLAILAVLSWLAWLMTDQLISIVYAAAAL